ncbi:MAG: tRNA lysidine(34) synthetase TilS [Actinobacteria bacterium]|nr:tRNA lysidine(34) synthetase TilS [Actinomycetota bacterium]
MTEKPLGGPGYPVVEAALGAIERYRMLEKGDVVVVAVSGGPDSVCLLDVLQRISSRLELTIHVAHVDHGLSDDSETIAGRVATRAAEAGFDVHVVRAPDLAGPNLHARAREFRYGFFDIVCEQTGARGVVTGHTLDDRAETILARLIHGAGTAVLAGVKPVDGNRLRPLLEVRRSETRAYCEEVVLEFNDDPGNDDLRFERAAVRKLLIGPIQEHWGEGAIRAIAMSAERLAEDAGALAGIADRLYADLVSEDDPTFDRAALVALPRAVRRRLLEAAVGRVRDRSAGIDEVLDALDADPKAGARYALPGGREIVIEKDRVVVLNPASAGDGDEDEA